MKLDDHRRVCSFYIILWFGYCSLAAEFICETHNDCAPNGSCNFNRLTCDCNDGWYGDRCDRDCKINCQNGSTCIEENLHGIDFENEWKCICKKGYSGGLCQIKDSALLDNTRATTPAQKAPSQQTAAVPFVVAMALLVLLAVAVGVYGVKRRKRQQSDSADVTTDPADAEEVELPKVT